MRRLCVCLLLLAAPAAGEKKKSLDLRVNEALDRAAASLLKRQEGAGGWQTDDKVHPLGRTALCAFALLHAGYLSDHPSIQKALRYLKLDNPQYHSEPKIHSTYEAGCMALFLNALGRQYRGAIHRICDWLIKNQDERSGLWGYPTGTPDLSNTQYAVFALKVGERHGYKVRPGVWRSLIEAMLENQHRSGAFWYRGNSVYRATMTHAALLVLLFANQSLGKKRAAGEVRNAMERGHRWVRERYSVDKTPWGNGWHTAHYYYYMYGLERYAQFFGMKEIDGHDWYREGAEALLERQLDDGSWGRLEATSFAILFLRKVTLTVPEGRKVGKPVERKREAKPARPKPDPGLPHVTEWLVAGPYPGETAGDDMLSTGHFKIPKTRVAEGMRAGKKKWAWVYATNKTLDLKLSAGNADWCTYYAAVYLHATQATGAHLWIGAQDGYKVFLNGTEVFFSNHHGWSGDDHDQVPLQLKKGANLVIVKIKNHTRECRLQMRVGQGPKPHPLVTVSAKRKG